MSANLERPTLKQDYDNLPLENYAGLGYPTHRYANILPIAEDKDQFALRESIRDLGRLVEPIVLFGGAILDGRHRYAACVKVGVEPTFTEFEGTEEQALQFVLAKNVARRQLTVIQRLRLREVLTDEIERLRAQARTNSAANGSNSETQPVGSLVGEVNKAVGAMVGVSAETIRQYDRVKDAAVEDTFMAEMLEAVDRGEVSVKKAYTSISDELDKLAKQDTSKVDVTKQKAVLKSAIIKAHAALVEWDPAVITADNEMADLLSDLTEWCAEAYNHAGA